VSAALDPANSMQFSISLNKVWVLARLKLKRSARYVRTPRAAKKNPRRKIRGFNVIQLGEDDLRAGSGDLSTSMR
jgi:hypothetical protein